MLLTYLKLTRRLMDDLTFARLNDFDLRDYINVARGQIAGQALCVPGYGTLAVNAATQQYPFSSINFGSATAGIQGPINIRMITWRVGQGRKRMAAREWPWFNNFVLAQPVPKAGQPQTWSQYSQGAAGSIFVNLLDGAYTLDLDTICYPVALLDDGTPEAIPYMWQDAVPFYATYYAYMHIQQHDAADVMWQRFLLMMDRARGGATPAVQPGSFSQGPDLMMPNRLGLHPPQRAA